MKTIKKAVISSTGSEHYSLLELRKFYHVSSLSLWSGHIFHAFQSYAIFMTTIMTSTKGKQKYQYITVLSQQINLNLTNEHKIS